MPRFRHVLRYCRTYKLLNGKLPSRFELRRYFGRPLRLFSPRGQP